jgi:hypothetical protein
MLAISGQLPTTAEADHKPGRDSSGSGITCAAQTIWKCKGFHSTPAMSPPIQEHPWLRDASFTHTRGTRSAVSSRRQRAIHHAAEKEKAHKLTTMPIVSARKSQSGSATEPGKDTDAFE